MKSDKLQWELETNRIPTIYNDSTTCVYVRLMILLVLLLRLSMQEKKGDEGEKKREVKGELWKNGRKCLTRSMSLFSPTAQIELERRINYCYIQCVEHIRKCNMPKTDCKWHLKIMWATITVWKSWFNNVNQLYIKKINPINIQNSSIAGPQIDGPHPYLWNAKLLSL